MREGSLDTLKAIGIGVTEIEKLADEAHGIISCSLIRQALTEGNLDLANRLLGWQWEMQGIVEKGEQRGRTLGFPTANVPLGETLHPAYGIYATWVKIVEDGPDAPWLLSATNIGIRPMFEILVGQIESFIFDFDRDIYGKTLRIRPVKRLRSEAKFDSLDALIKQMEQDCRQAREILERSSA
jgi:riboflavin kinase/FMN adenylyltransferase